MCTRSENQIKSLKMMGRSVMLIGLSDRGQRTWQNVSKKSNFMKWQNVAKMAKCLKQGQICTIDAIECYNAIKA